MEHLDENLILELVGAGGKPGALGARRTEIEAHLDGCPACLELLALVASSTPGVAPTEPDLTRHLAAGALAPGDLLAGRFRLEGVVGEGGMGVVWSAHDTQASRGVALKILKEVGPSERRRFLREARLMTALSHPNILDVKEVVTVGDEGDVVLVMDLLEGESLGARLARAGKLSFTEAASILVPLVLATQAAHARGVVHRDLKPENVFLRRDGLVVLLDFGMAKLASTVDLGASGWLTESGVILGTPHYMAPEQILGERDVDHRADVWSIGVVAYECLSGERPVEGKSLGQIVRSLGKQEIRSLAERVRDVPARFAAVVDQMLSIDREARPSLAAVLAELQSVPAS